MVRLLNDAVGVVSAAISSASAPALFTSFGKDSMAVLGILREAGALTSVSFITFRHPAFLDRYTFADRLISDWQLRVEVVPHAWDSMIAGNGRVDLIGTVRIATARIHIPVANLVWSEDSGSHICALDNEMPVSGVPLVERAFDLAILGTKEGDTDPVVGAVRLAEVVDRYKDRTALLFPLRKWTDDDVWAFLLRYHIPFDRSRYVQTYDGALVDDLKYAGHPELLPVCTACINPALKDSVWCPKVQHTVASRTAVVKRRQYPSRSHDGVPEIVAL